MTTIFRTLVIGAFLLQIVWFFLPHVSSSWLGSEELDLLSWDGFGMQLPWHPLLSFVLLGLYGGVSVGLVLFHRWARTGFLLLTVAMVGAGPFFGFVVMPPVDAMLLQVMHMMDGGILALAYLSSLGGNFEDAAQQYARADRSTATRFRVG